MNAPMAPRPPSPNDLLRIGNAFALRAREAAELAPENVTFEQNAERVFRELVGYRGDISDANKERIAENLNILLEDADPERDVELIEAINRVGDSVASGFGEWTNPSVPVSPRVVATVNVAKIRAYLRHKNAMIRPVRRHRRRVRRAGWLT